MLAGTAGPESTSNAASAAVNGNLKVGQRRPFTVDDAIRYARVVDAHEVGFSDKDYGPVLFSPDRTHLAIRTRKGDPQGYENFEEIDVYKVSTACSARSSGDSLEVAAKSLFATHRRRDISHLAWTDTRHLAFIAPTRDASSQVFVLDVASRSTTQVTNHPTDVLSFDVQGDTVVYFARVRAETSPAVVVDDSNWDDLLFPGEGLARDYYHRIQLFRSALSHPTEARAIGSPYVLPFWFEDIHVSPDERFAIVLAPATNWPEHWEQYQVPIPEIFSYSKDKRTANANTDQLVLKARFMIVDLASGSVAPLLDAPVSMEARNGTPRRVYWTNDSKMVVISGSWMPLSLGVSKAAFSKLAKQQPAIAAVSIDSGRVQPLVWEPSYEQLNGQGGDGARIVGVEWDWKSEQLFVRRKGTPDERWQYLGSRWGSIREKVGSTLRKAKFPRVVTLEALNSRPRFRVESSDECSQYLPDLNSWIDDVSVARAELVEWTDRNGRQWRGGLVLPPTDEPNKKYPLVVQTHGFSPTEFLIDGPSTDGGTTAFAAQPLAAAGMAVLQIQLKPMPDVPRSEQAKAYAAGYYAGIQSLVGRGLVDPERIGAVAWSATGTHVLQLMIDQPGLLAAVVLSDTAQLGYLGYILGVNYSKDFTKQYEAATGGPPPWDALTVMGAWFQQNNFYRIADLQVPTRLEAIGPNMLMHTWEAFALRKYRRLPVDFVYYPNGEHSLFMPSQRKASLEGTVDWFRFWLLGDESADPGKSAQYERWRQFRSDIARE